MSTTKGTKIDLLTTPYVLVRSFLTKLIFLLILFCVLTLFLQTNLAKLLRVGSTHPAPTLPPSNCFLTTPFKSLYPPLYERLVWDYKSANVQLINGAIECFNVEKLFNG